MAGTPQEEANVKRDKYIDLEKLTASKIDSIDDFLNKTQSIGSMEKAVSESLYGINHTKVPNATIDNKDNFGYAFFTRPQLNLSDSNLVHVRKFIDLLTEKDTSIHRYVRMMLDPSLKIASKKAIDSPYINNRLAFIPLLTNNLKNMSGWPDMVMPTYTSKQGLKKEQWGIADGMVDIYDSFDIDCTFRNTISEPIILMMQTWLYYMSYVFEGLIVPYPIFIAENEIDYNTRIYRIVMDTSNRRVTKIAAVGASMPINVPTGKLFDFSSESPYNVQNKDLNIRFKCYGAMYNDSILIDEFNKTSVIFNPNIKKVIASGFKSMSGHKFDKIPQELKDRFNHRGYPLINTETFELDWWLDTAGEDKVTWEQVMNDYKGL